MGFLRRLFGWDDTSNPRKEIESDPAVPDPADLDVSEREHELEVLRAEQDRFDELTQRQLRYADYAWEPPAQGGDRRADDEDARDAT
jgi:hypothetical protein